jgi:signal-transduction protein with cAMP-binding, CBS, and nucleotidyltransferase domain
MRSQRIPLPLQERVRDYYSFLWERQRGTDISAVLSDIPHGLSEEILLFLNHDMISRVPIFAHAEELFLREAVRILKPQIFLPGEYIIRQGEFADCMYFLTSGSVRVLVNDQQVASLGPGSAFGEKALLDNRLRNASVVSDCYGTGYRMGKESFNELRAKYPDFDRQVEAIAKSRQ